MKNTTSRAITEQTPSVRQGTAIRRAGKVTAAKIMVAAKEVLEQEDISRFTMRNVAEGLKLVWPTSSTTTKPRRSYRSLIR